MRKKGPARTPIEQRFWRKVSRDGPLPAAWSPARAGGRCWLWTASLSVGGYGKLGAGGHGSGWVNAHRVSWEIHRGPIPEGLELDHLCRVRRCVNPAHLELVTSRENILRGEAHQRSAEARGRAAREREVCGKGHPLVEGTFRYRGNYRQCKACEREWSQKARDRAKLHVTEAAAGLDSEWDAALGQGRN